MILFMILDVMDLEYNLSASLNFQLCLSALLLIKML